MKKILLFLFFFIFVTSFAQLDREHWFAPMVDAVSQINTNQYQSIYLSTNETTPFNVDIYHNNVIIASTVISKNNPVKYKIENSDRNKIITTAFNDLFTPVAMGFYLKGEKPFFASLRFSITNHGEIQTSKGTAALGTEFRAVMAPISVTNSILNFMNSVMATEDITRVTITEFDPNITFSDGIPRTQITFTLNKGQSYIIDGNGSNLENFTGYIGAKIVSDKPIVIANGNFNGQYAGNFPNGSDILMDQGVPIDKLGKEFILMKGNGANSFNGGNSTMENAIIVAAKDNTNIYLNGSPTAAASINAGQFFVTPPNSYIDQGSEHYNMLINSSEDVYVYQLLAGVQTTTSQSNLNGEATGGFNYIPPLNCYLPKKIDEIGKIEENEYSLGSGTNLSVPTKLNIITERGASIDVQRNGVSLILDALNGPFDVTGNSAWVTYSVPNITGNIAIFSSNAVTAGISAGNGAVGYGGYFAGFSSIPLILKSSGECLPGVSLEVTEGYTSYKWLLKVGSTYIPAPGISNIFKYEPTQAGIYAVKVQQGTCPEIQTADFKFYNCTTYTNYDYTTCTEQLITPQFALSSQTINNTTLKIDTPPTKGTVVINADGTITYTAKPNAIGSDTFKFSFCGNGAIADCETVQATITLNQIEKYDIVLEECSATGSATYDLREAAVTPDSTVSKSYYQTEGGAENEIAAEVISNFANFTTIDRFVWARMKNTFGCVAVSRIELKAKLPADVKPELYVRTHCDEDVDGVIDGIYKVDVNAITPFVLQTPANHVVLFYEDEAKATANGTDDIKDIFSFTKNRSIWIRVEPKNGCDVIIKEILLTTGRKLALATPIPVPVCDNNLDNTENIDLINYLPSFTTAAYDSVSYFDDLTKAHNNLPTQNINSAQAITGDKTFYYRFSKAEECDAIGTLIFSFKKSTPTALANSYTVCTGDSISLTAEDDSIYKAWLWEKGGVTISTDQTADLNAGVYLVSFTNFSDCIFTKTITVVDSPKPQWNISTFNGTYCDDDLDGIITVKFSTITPTIISNSSIFKVEYSLFSNFSTLLPDDWTYTANTTVHVRSISTFCPEERKTVDFRIGDKLTIIKTTHTASECDDDLDGIKTVNLTNYESIFTTKTGVTATYFKTLADAQKNTGAIPSTVSITNSGTYYLRFQKVGVCDNIGTLTITIKVPKKSAVLVDKNICPEATTTLDAGSGFSKYLWSNGSTAQSIKVTVGDYWVELTADGCTYRQQVSVKAVPVPVITGVEIQGGTVTVLVTGGNPPYQYSLNGSTYQRSNVFNDIQPGNYTVFVISADECIPTTTEINILRIQNVITPNDDGKNDVLTYADLLRKDNPFLQIFDRYGVSVFKGDKNNSFSWDGKISGKAVATGSYWYVLQWQEPSSTTVSKMTGWVLVKSRE